MNRKVKFDRFRGDVVVTGGNAGEIRRFAHSTMMQCQLVDAIERAAMVIFKVAPGWHGVVFLVFLVERAMGAEMNGPVRNFVFKA
ncbi:hypothetical protein GD416_34615 [Burkholderia sp. BE24]|uniref:hypothetical protein n=1 Tax=unclassified Burkholderia TaxID=2613784 RepID=UPI0011804C12|nr:MULTISPECIES: hypothetical protein [unclassified Burkholderia]MPV61416.1 hypothetical protein [Burkholderia sp. BE24]